MSAANHATSTTKTAPHEGRTSKAKPQPITTSLSDRGTPCSSLETGGGSGCTDCSSPAMCQQGAQQQTCAAHSHQPHPPPHPQSPLSVLLAEIDDFSDLRCSAAPSAEALATMSAREIIAIEAQMAPEALQAAFDAIISSGGNTTNAAKDRQRCGGGGGSNTAAHSAPYLSGGMGSASSVVGGFGGYHGGGANADATATSVSAAPSTIPSAHRTPTLGPSFRTGVGARYDREGGAPRSRTNSRVGFVDPQTPPPLMCLGEPSGCALAAATTVDSHRSPLFAASLRRPSCNVNHHGNTNNNNNHNNNSNSSAVHPYLQHSPPPPPLFHHQLSAAEAAAFEEGSIVLHKGTAEVDGQLSRVGSIVRVPRPTTGLNSVAASKRPSFLSTREGSIARISYGGGCGGGGISALSSPASPPGGVQVTAKGGGSAAGDPSPSAVNSPLFYDHFAAPPLQPPTPLNGSGSCGNTVGGANATVVAGTKVINGIVAEANEGGEEEEGDRLAPLVFASSGFGSVNLMLTATAETAAEIRSSPLPAPVENSQQSHQPLPPYAAACPEEWASPLTEDEAVAPNAGRRSRSNSRLSSVPLRHSRLIQRAGIVGSDYVVVDEAARCQVATPTEPAHALVGAAGHSSSPAAEAKEKSYASASASASAAPPMSTSSAAAVVAEGVVFHPIDVYDSAPGSCSGYPHNNDNNNTVNQTTRSAAFHEQLKSSSKATEARGLQNQMRKRNVKELAARQLSAMLHRTRAALVALHSLERTAEAKPAADAAASAAVVGATSTPADPLRSAVARRREEVMALAKAYNAVVTRVNVQLAALGLPPLAVEPDEDDGGGDGERIAADGSGRRGSSFQPIASASSRHRSRAGSLSSAAQLHADVVGSYSSAVAEGGDYGCTPLPPALAADPSLHAANGGAAQRCIRHPKFLGMSAGVAYAQQQEQQTKQGGGGEWEEATRCAGGEGYAASIVTTAPSRTHSGATTYATTAGTTAAAPTCTTTSPRVSSRSPATAAAESAVLPFIGIPRRNPTATAPAGEAHASGNNRAAPRAHTRGVFSAGGCSTDEGGGPSNITDVAEDVDDADETRSNASSEERIIGDEEAEAMAASRRVRAAEARAEIARLSLAAPAAVSDDTFLRENLHRFVPHTTFLTCSVEDGGEEGGVSKNGLGQVLSPEEEAAACRGGVRRHSGIVAAAARNTGGGVPSPSSTVASAAPSPASSPFPGGAAASPPSTLVTEVSVTLRIGQILTISKEIVPSQGKFADCRFLSNGHGPDGVSHVLLKLRKIDSAELLFGSDARGAAALGIGRVLSGNEARVLTWFFAAKALGESTIMCKETQISVSANANTAILHAAQQQQQMHAALSAINEGGAAASRQSSAAGSRAASVVGSPSFLSGECAATTKGGTALCAAAIAAAAEQQELLTNQHGHTTIFGVTVVA